MAIARVPTVPDWEHLRFFLELVRTASLSAAARRLGVDHTTVSRRISALEASLGVKLFDRVPRGYEPTAAARSVQALAERLEEQVLAIERQVALGSELGGTVRLSTTAQLAIQFVIPSLAALRERHPGLVVEVAARNRVVSLTRREADVAVRLGRPRESGLVTRRLGELAYAFYGARDPRRPRTLDPERDRFVGFDDSLAHVQQERWLDEVLPDRVVAFRANNLPCLQAAARIGLGVAVMPCLAGDADPGLERLASPLQPQPRELWLAVLGELRRSARIRAVLDALVEHAEAMRLSFAGVPPPGEPPARGGADPRGG